jgi:hypothetical protein
MAEPIRLPLADGEVVIAVEDQKVRLTAPAGGALLTEDEALQLAREVVLAGSQLSDPTGEDAARWRRWPMQYVRFDAEPVAGGPTVTVHGWIADQTEANAVFIAVGNIEAGEEYRATELAEQRPCGVEDYEEGDEFRPYFEQALTDGEVFLFEHFGEDDS